mmetsp:Transcript_47056/g.105721  ORF Transcript_47056/g.105721 Transcript_47056/m.105721 type:complete len:412 (-) Transcript_47056:112-1347(-)
MGCGASAKTDHAAEVKEALSQPIRKQGTTASLTRSQSIKHTVSNTTNFFRRISMGSLTSLFSFDKKFHNAETEGEEDEGTDESDRPKTFEERVESVDLTGIMDNAEREVATAYFFSDNIISKRTKVVIRMVVHKKTDVLMACKQHTLRTAAGLGKHSRSPETIKRQAIMLNECRHPNIIELMECFMHNGYFYEVLEYAAGGRLFEAIVNAETHTERETANIMIQSLSAVNFMHQRKICHRDIKPEHIVFKEVALAEVGEIKLVDFATACLFTEEPMTEKVTTPYYASPQVHEGLYTESLDIWSCGVVMYLLLTGYPRKAKAMQEFKNVQSDDFRKALTKGKLHSLQERVGFISKEAGSLMDQLLVTSEEHRITPARAVRTAWLQSQAPQHVSDDERREHPGGGRDRGGQNF